MSESLSLNACPVVLNLYAGPGAGKSTVAALTFGLLKSLGARVELVTEYAKELVYEGHDLRVFCQEQISTTQYYRQARLVGQVEAIVTDSPLLLGLLYGSGQITRNYAGFVRDAYDRFDNLAVCLLRDREAHPYADYGRVQTEAEALRRDDEIAGLLLREAIQPAAVVTAAQPMEAARQLAPLVLERLESRR